MTLSDRVSFAGDLWDFSLSSSTCYNGIPPNHPGAEESARRHQPSPAPRPWEDRQQRNVMTQWDGICWVYSLLQLGPVAVYQQKQLMEWVKHSLYLFSMACNWLSMVEQLLLWSVLTVQAFLKGLYISKYVQLYIYCINVPRWGCTWGMLAPAILHSCTISFSAGSWTTFLVYKPAVWFYFLLSVAANSHS